MKKDLAWAGLLLLAVVTFMSALLYSSVLCPGGLTRAREGAAEHLIDQLAQAARSYELDWGVNSPGCGHGSAGLVRALSAAGPGRSPYFDFPPDMLSGGHVINPVWPDGEGGLGVIHFRNNLQPNTCPHPPARPGSGFDLWAADGARRRHGIRYGD